MKYTTCSQYSKVISKQKYNLNYEKGAKKEEIIDEKEKRERVETGLERFLKKYSIDWKNNYNIH